MATMMEWHASAAVGEWAVDPEQRPLVVRLYLERLTRLVQLEVTDIPTLSAEEQRRLRTRAVVGAIETLTALGAGTSASDLLRAARCPRDRAASYPLLAVPSREGYPDGELRGLSQGAACS